MQGQPYSGLAQEVDEVEFEVIDHRDQRLAHVKKVKGHTHSSIYVFMDT